MLNTVSFKIDEQDKKDAQALFDSMGLTFSGAMNLFIKACINTRSIPFEVKAPNSYEEIIKKRLKEAENSAKRINIHLYICHITLVCSGIRKTKSSANSRLIKLCTPAF